MPDIPNRSQLEKKIARLLGKYNQQQLGELLKMMGNSPSMAKIPPSFWTESEQALAAELVPFSEDVYLQAAQRVMDSVPLPIGFDWTLVNQDAADWAVRKVGKLVTEITDTTRKGIGRAVSSYFTEAQTIGDLELRLARMIDKFENILGAKRAEMISVTEITRAATQGELGVARQLKNEGIDMRKVWQTNKDDLVCFPAWTLVKSKRGDIPIQNIQPGEKVLTRSGWKTVTATSKREYSGPMRVMKTDDTEIIATSNHPVWELKKGWLNIGDFKIGDRVYTVNNEIADVRSISDFCISNSNNMPSSATEILVLSGISVGITMPISTINFEGDAMFCEKEINGITSHFGFLNVVESNFIKSYPGRFLKKVFPVGFPITRKRTKLAVFISRRLSKFFAASRAIDINWRSAAFLGAIISTISFLSNIESFATPFAYLILGVCKSALFTAYGIAILNTFINFKIFATDRTDLRYFFRHTMTFSGAIYFTPFHPMWSKIKFLATLFADKILSTTLSFLRRIFESLGINWHVAQLLTRLLVLYHGTCAKPIIVYDLEVDGAHEFFANGLLVHNCSICEPLQGAEESVWRSVAPDGPPAHVRCRCFLSLLLPKVTV